MKDLVDVLKRGSIAVIPTDTIYGIVCSALNKDSVEKVYSIRNRRPDKPVIILISSLEDLTRFGITVTEKERAFLQKVWPGKVSVILPCETSSFSYLHRGTNSLAFRLPDKADLLELLKETGPLIAPSANPEGEKEAKTIEEAKNYFGDLVAVYQNGGALESKPSTLVRLQDGDFEVIRQGAVDVGDI